MLVEKKALSFEELEAQTALELPNREMPLITVVLVNVLSDIEVTLRFRDVNVCTQVVANLLALGIFVLEDPTQTVNQACE